MKKLGFYSIRMKILLMFLMVSIPIIVILISMSDRLGQEAVLKLMNKSETKDVEISAQIVHNWLEERMDEIEIYANTPLVKDMDWDKMKPYLKEEIEKKMDGYNTFFVADRNGLCYDTEVNYSSSISDRDYFKRVMDGNTTLSEPIIGKTTGDEIIVMAVPIKDENNQVVGLMGADVSLKKLNDFVEELKVDHPESYSYLLSKEGVIITHPNEGLIMKEPLKGLGIPSKGRTKASVLPPILKDHKGMINGNTNVYYFHEVDGTNGWRIVTVVPKEYFQGPMKELGKTMLWIGFIGMIFAILLGLYMCRKISKPIIQLNEVFMKGASGDLTVRANVLSKDEIGIAARSFNVMMETISHMTYFDPLTHLPNREFFSNQLKSALSHSIRNKEKLAVIAIALDRFKNVNDTLGHDVGDKLLREVGAELKTLIGEEDFIFRMGGSQFILLITEIGKMKNPVKITEEILHRMKKTWFVNENELYMTASIGIAIYPEDGEDEQSLLRNADTAMHKVKERGGNTYGLYSSSMNKILIEQLDLDKKLRYALEKDEMHVYYQPKVDVHRGEMMGMEALVRWKDSEIGMISPVKFIPLAEENGCILSIGEWVMRRACEQNKEWQEAGYRSITVAVNISAVQFQQPNFVEIVRSILEETRLDPKYLELEITESIAIEDKEYTIEVLKVLKEMNVKIAMDDFGTGYSSLSYLKRFAIDTLKIDQSFVRDITTDENGRSIATTIIAMGHNLNMKIVAEGVETEEQLEFLKEENCDEIQGYFYSPPVPPEEFEKFFNIKHES